MEPFRVSPLVISALSEAGERSRRLADRLQALPLASPPNEVRERAALQKDVGDTRETLDYVCAQLQNLADALGPVTSSPPPRELDLLDEPERGTG